MKALVLYDSVYGNTRKVAETIGANLGEPENVKALSAKEAKLDSLSGIQLLVIGSPTQKMTALSAIKSFLNQIPEHMLVGISVAVFDTRISIKNANSKLLTFFVNLFGYAADSIVKKIRKKGGKILIEPEGFIVTGTEGPLQEGELDRAAAWANQISEQI